MNSSNEIERHLLGALLIDPSRLDEVLGTLQPSDFYRDTHRRLFELLVDRRSRGLGIDLTLVLEQIGNAHEADFGGVRYVSMLGDHVGTTENLSYYVTQLHGAASKRAIGSAARDLKNAADNGHEPGTVIEMAQALASSAIVEEGWPDPGPIEPELPPFPLELLPPRLAEYCTAIAAFREVPADVPGMIMLGMMAVAIRGRSYIQIVPGFKEFLTLYVVLAAESGEGKSAPFLDLVKPIWVYESTERARMAPTIALKKAEQTMLKKQLEAATRKCSKAPKDPELQAELKSAVEAYEACTVPSATAILVDDATPESVAQFVADNGYAGIMSDEGAIFDNMVGQYNKGVAKLDIFNHGHTGRFARVHRKGGPPLVIESTRIGIVSAIQPSVVAKLAANREVQGRGTFARLLLSMPGSRAGFRTFTASSPLLELETFYRRRALEVMTADVPVKLELVAAAADRWFEYRRQFELRFRSDGDLHEVKSWGNKLVGQLARIAGILHLWDHPSDRYVGLEHMERGLAFAEYFVAHALTAYGLGGTNGAPLRLVRVLNALKVGPKSASQIRRLKRGGRNPMKAAEVDESLAFLEERGHARRVSDARGTVWVLHPSHRR